MNRPSSILLIAAVLASLPIGASAQDAEKDQLKKELTEQKELLTLQKDVINAQKDVLGAQLELLEKKLPALPEGKPGSVTFDSGAGDSLHATAQAYEALALAAQEVCSTVVAVSGKEAKRVALVSPDDLRLAAQYRIVAGEITALQREYNRELSKVVTAALPVAAIGPILSTLVDVSKLFRTDRKLSFADVTGDEVALADQIAACLQTKLPGKVSYARVEMGNALGFGSGKLHADLSTLAENDEELAAKIRQLEDDLAKPEDPKKGAAAAPKAGGDSARKKEQLAQWKALSERYKALLKSLEGTDATVKSGVLLSVLQGEAIDRMVRCEPTAQTKVVCAEGDKNREVIARLLSTRVVKAGGTTMVTSSVWSEDKVYSSGGVVVTYRLTDGATVQAAGSIQKDSQLREIQKLSAR